MSSGVLTKRSGEDPQSKESAPPERSGRSGRSGTIPWFLLVPAGAAAVAAVALFGVLRVAPNPGAVLLVLAAAAFGGVAIQFWRALQAAAWEPPQAELSAAGSRRKRELEREKRLLLKAIKELEFDHEMGKVSDTDYREAYAVYRSRAIRTMAELDAGAGAYRQMIERELADRLGRETEIPSSTPTSVAMPSSREMTAAASKCACGSENDPDAVFCKKCGTRLIAEADR